MVNNVLIRDEYSCVLSRSLKLSEHVYVHFEIITLYQSLDTFYDLPGSLCIIYAQHIVSCWTISVTESVIER